MFYEVGDEDASERAVSPVQGVLLLSRLGLPNGRKSSKFLFLVCRNVGKVQPIILAFAEPSASRFLFFRRLPNHRQSSFYFFFRLPKRRQGTNFLFDVCRNLGKVQHLFLTLAEASANPFMLFCALLLPQLSVICSSTTGRWCGNGLRFWAKPLDVCADQYTSPVPLPCH